MAVKKTATYGYGEMDFRGNVHVKPGSVTKKKKAQARARAREVTLTLQQAEDFINSLQDSARFAWRFEESGAIVDDVMELFEKLFKTPLKKKPARYWADSERNVKIRVR